VNVAPRLPAFAGASFAETAIRIVIDPGPVPSSTGPGGVFPVVFRRGFCLCCEIDCEIQLSLDWLARLFWVLPDILGPHGNCI